MFPRYPMLPVRACRGFEEGPEDPWAKYTNQEEK
jgi:hypothetical protein